MRVINREQMVDILEGRVLHQFLAVVAETEPKCVKSGRVTGLTIQQKLNRQHVHIMKHSEFVCGIGYSYPDLIDHRLEAQGKDSSEYKAGPSWHIPVDGTKCLKQHPETGELYVYVALIANNIPKVAYYNDATGEGVEKETIKEFLPKEYAPKNQGLDEGTEINVRTFKLTSIKELHMDGEVLIVKP